MSRCSPPNWQGCSLKEVCPLQQAIPVALSRAGRAILPNPETRLETGDVLQVSATLEGAKALRQKIG